MCASLADCELRAVALLLVASQSLASPHRPHAAARQPHSQQPQSQGPALPRQPSAASAPRLSRQLSPPSPPSPPRAKARPRARLPNPRQPHSQAGGAHWSCATGQTRQLCQPRARSTLA
ncbi:hypothetical protein HaLaN_24898 [Haematococcus lacustris]|uniref:Uncharacterized protein n=1 Tax=Haematococcus lacustris TaxID=44745 RepID=A0A6A0A301_HAELA|nr:hypothetical protein HaLaN_24898 [Haematococcus lacustris]